MPQRRELSCPNCGQKLRLNVEEKSFGNEIEVTCRKCTKKFKTTISFLPEKKSLPDDATLLRIRLLAKEFGEAMYNAIGNNSALLEVVEKIRAEGYDPILSLTAALEMNKLDGDTPVEMHEPTPLVQDGEVVPGAFTEADQKLMKDLRITFEK